VRHAPRHRAPCRIGGPLLLVLAGCAQAPTRFEECAALSDVTAREDCRLDFARQLLDDPGALQAAIDSVEPADSRDLLLLRLAVAEPARAGWLCTRVQGAGAQEKCRQVLGRPHLSTTPQAPRPQQPVAP